MKKRSIGIMILLYLITFGIYPLYWYCSFQNQLKKQTGEGFSGGMHFFISLITFGIYPLYWQYAAGKRLSKLGATNHSVMYLLFAIFVSGFLNPFLMQNQANNLK